MSQQLVNNYTINSGSKTVTLTDFTTILPERIISIRDVTQDVELYNALGGTTNISVATNVITFTTLPTSVTNTDKLQIIYNSLSGDPTYDASGPIKQDSTASIAKETGGNLATIATNTTGLATSANQTNGTQQAKITDGTNIAGILVPGTANSSGNAQLVGGTSQQVAFTTTTVQAVATTDVGNYSWVSVQITGQGTSSTVTFQGSNDNSTWVTVSLVSAASTSSAASTATTGTGIFAGPINYRYFRLNVTGISAGTTAGTIEFFTSPRTQNTMGGGFAFTGATATTGSITTSSTAVTSTSASNFIGFALVSIHGTYSGVSFGITLSDDSQTTFYNTAVYDVTANQWLAPGTTITPGTNASKLYWVPVSPTGNSIKVLSSAFSSGSGSVRISWGYGGNPGSFMSQLMDAAGNNRGANVTASNALVVDNSSVSPSLAPSATVLNPYSVHLTTNTTTTPTSTTSYISSISISIGAAGTTSTLTIQDKQGTALKLVNALATTAVTTAPTVINFQTPIKMVSGIDIITAGVVAATIDVWVNYYQ